VYQSNVIFYCFIVVVVVVVIVVAVVLTALPTVKTTFGKFVWNELPQSKNTPEPRHLHSCVVYKDIAVYCFGGFGFEGKSYSTLDKFDLGTCSDCQESVADMRSALPVLS